MRDRRIFDQQLTEEMEKKIFVQNRNSNIATEWVDVNNESIVTTNPLYDSSHVAPIVQSSEIEGRILKAKYSFHGVETDELNVASGETLTAIDKTNDWYICKDSKGQVGLIPASYIC